MRKITLTLAAALTLCSFSSCIKNYTCECTSVYNNPPEPVRTDTWTDELPAGSRKDAAEACVGDENPQPPLIITCQLK